MKKTHVAFCLDESGSVRGILAPLVKSYNKSVEDIRNTVIAEGQEATMTALAFGDEFLKHRVLYRGMQVQTVVPLKTTDLDPSGMTPLFDSVSRAIDELKMLDEGDVDTAMLVTVVTDGDENSSHNIQATIAKMNQMIGTDRWTFTFMVPKGAAFGFSRKYGIAPGNVMEWDATSAVGTERAFNAHTQATTTYFASRSLGATATKKFYVDLTDIKPQELAKNAVDVSSDILLMQVVEDARTDDFASKMGITYEHGKFFYQLTKTEPAVQAYKIIMIRNKINGKIYAGDVARQMIGLPTFGTVKVAPASKSGDFEIFIQSTAPNRKLPKGTNAIYWKDAKVNK